MIASWRKFSIINNSCSLFIDWNLLFLQPSMRKLAIVPSLHTCSQAIMDPQFVFLDHQQRCAISVPGLHDSDPDRVEQRQFGKSNSGPQPVDECTLSIQVYCQNGSLPDLDARDQRILDLLDHVARTVITGLSECRFIPQLPHPYTGYRIEVYHGQPNLRVYWPPYPCIVL